MRKTAVSLTAMIAAAGALTVGGLRPAQALPRAPQAKVAIWEIYYNSPGSDTGTNASLDHEWVQLHNTTSRTVTITDWTLRDKAGHVYVFGPYQLKAHAFVKIHTGHGRPINGNRYWAHSWYIWNNNGDTAVLKTASGTAEARCGYADPDERSAFTRCGH
jgi:hypothetical protein